jgi:hypothetical protein
VSYQIENKNAFKSIRTLTPYGENSIEEHIFYDKEMISFQDCIEHYKNHIEKEARSLIDKYGSVKLNIEAKIIFYNDDLPEEHKKLKYLLDFQTKPY